MSVSRCTQLSLRSAAASSWTHDCPSSPQAAWPGSSPHCDTVTPTVWRKREACACHRGRVPVTWQESQGCAVGTQGREAGGEMGVTHSQVQAGDRRAGTGQQAWQGHALPRRERRASPHPATTPALRTPEPQAPQSTRFPVCALPCRQRPEASESDFQCRVPTAVPQRTPGHAKACVHAVPASPGLEGTQGQTVPTRVLPTLISRPRVRRNRRCFKSRPQSQRHSSGSGTAWCHSSATHLGESMRTPGP